MNCKSTNFILFLSFLFLAVCSYTTQAYGVGESSTRFNTYVPAYNDNNGREAGLVITATGEGVDGVTKVRVWDMPADTCPNADCDPFGYLASGNDGVIADGTTFTAMSYNFSAEPYNNWFIYARRYIVINDQAYRITAYNIGGNPHAVELETSAPDGSNLDWVFAQAGDVEDSYTDISLQRGESFVVYMLDANGCLTGGSCNSSRPNHTALSKTKALAFFNELQPSLLQQAALQASFATYPLLPIDDDTGADDSWTDISYDQRYDGRDGDYFIIQADSPVIVQTASRSSWEHDTIVSDTKNAMGQSFYVFGSGGSNKDIEIFAHEDNTYVTIKRISSSAYNNAATGIARVSWDPEPAPLSIDGSLYNYYVLDAGQSLNIWNRTINVYEDADTDFDYSRRDQGINFISAGHTYFVQATKPVTMMYGILQSYASGPNRSARDGGGMAASETGTSSGQTFYLTIPYQDSNDGERELRIQSFDDENIVCVDVFNVDGRSWQRVKALSSQTDAMIYTDDSSETLRGCVYAMENTRIDMIGHDWDSQSDYFRDYDLLRVRCSDNKKITVAEANWMETGSAGTSDMASFISPQNLEDEFASEVRFLAYVPPPGTESNVRGVGSTYSHIFVFAEHDGTSLRISPTDFDVVPSACNDEFPHEGNTVRIATIPADGFYDFQIDTSCYNAMDNSPVTRPYLEIIADSNVAVLVSNYNDNWLNYTTSLLPATPNLWSSVEPSLLSLVEDGSGGIDRLDSAVVSIHGRHLFPVGRYDLLEGSSFEIIIPDGLSLSGPVEVYGAPVAVQTSSEVRSDGRTYLGVWGYDQEAFTTVTIEFPVSVMEHYRVSKGGAAVSASYDEQLTILVKQSGIVSGVPMSGYTSSAVRIFRCTRGDDFEDPDNDGQCSDASLCHTVSGVSLCSGPDVCPRHYGTNYDDIGRCPLGYTCGYWGACSSANKQPPCSLSSLEGFCAVAVDVLDSGLTCKPDGSCEAIVGGEACALGGDYCAERQSCQSSVCVEIDTTQNEGCTQRSDGFGYCPNSYACVAGQCLDKTGDECGLGGELCSHDGYCNISSVCEEIAEDERCAYHHPFGDCPHRLTCIESACLTVGGSEECGVGGSEMCSGSEACVNDVCVDRSGQECELGNGSLCPHGMACVHGSCVWLDEPDICESIPFCLSGLVEPCVAGSGYCPHDQVCVESGCIDAASEERCGQGGSYCSHSESCIDDECVTVLESEECESGQGTYCPHGYACVASVCVEILVGEDCEDGGSYCAHGYSCVDASCIEPAPGDMCGSGGYYCSHEQACIAGVCETIPDGEECGSTDWGVCAHGGACLFDGCSDVAVEDRCGSVDGSYCSHSQVCIAGVCREVADELHCEEGGSYCPHELSCIAGVCQEVIEDDRCGYGGTVCPHEESCIGDECVEVSNTDACGSGGSLCPHGMACVADSCSDISIEDACETGGSYCPHGMACVSEVCVYFEDDESCSLTNMSGWCEHGLVCLNGACIDPATVDECSCLNRSGVCEQGSICACPDWGEDCSTDNCGCEAVVVPCSLSNPTGYCGGGMLCLDGACRYECSVSHPSGYCGGGEACVSGECNGVCSETYPTGYCAEGYVCDGFECVRACSEWYPNGWCSNGGTCVDGDCVGGSDGGEVDGGGMDGGEVDGGDIGPSDQMSGDNQQQGDSGWPGYAGDNSPVVRGASGCGCQSSQGVSLLPWVLVGLMIVIRKRLKRI